MIQNFSQEEKRRQALQIFNRTLVIWIVIGCAIFVSCGDEGDVVEQPDAVKQSVPPDANGQLPPADGGAPDKDDKVEPEPVPVPLPGLPAITAGYQNWLKLNAEPIPPVVGGDPITERKTYSLIRTKGRLPPVASKSFPIQMGASSLRKQHAQAKTLSAL